MPQCRVCGVKPAPYHIGDEPFTPEERDQIDAYNASFQDPVTGDPIFHTGQLPTNLLRLPAQHFCEQHRPPNAMKDDDTIGVRACQFLRMVPWSTATQVAEALRAMKPICKCSTAAVASCLKRLTDEGILTRKSGCGPRGGMGYKIAKEKKPLTWHQRLLNES